PLLETAGPASASAETLAWLGAHRSTLVEAHVAGGVQALSDDVVDAMTSAGAWAPLPPLTGRRESLAAAAMPDGSVFVVGGDDGTGRGGLRRRRGGAGQRRGGDGRRVHAHYGHVEARAAVVDRTRRPGAGRGARRLALRHRRLSHRRVQRRRCRRRRGAAP